MAVRYQFFIIGAGGTGTYFLKEFARFLCANPVSKDIRSLYIFDGDIVEEKNIQRQAFLFDDIGRNKATCMAEILNETFSLDFKAVADYLTQKEQITGFFQRNRAIPVLISCVDNHACRLLLEEIFQDEKDCILLDSGNEFETGEVVYAYKRDGKTYGPPRSYYFPDIKTGDLRDVTQMSCSELNAVAPQHIFTNMLAGNLLLSGINNLFSGVITPGVTYFNAKKYDVAFYPFKPEE